MQDASCRMLDTLPRECHPEGAPATEGSRLERVGAIEGEFARELTGEVMGTGFGVAGCRIQQIEYVRDFCKFIYSKVY